MASLFRDHRRRASDRLRPALPIAAGMTLASQVGSVRVPVEMLVELLTARRGPRDFEPRTLLDYLAVWLLVFRRQGKLAVCKRKDCKRFFVKAHPRYRYCSTDCSDEIRKAGKALWFRNNRGASTKITAKKRNLARK